MSENERILIELADQQRILEAREANLERVQTMICETSERMARLQKEAGHWEAGISASEQAIAELTEELAGPDMTPTGEGADDFTDSDGEWAAAGFILSED